MLRRAIGANLRLLPRRPVYTTQVLLARKRSNKGFLDKKKVDDEDDDDHLAKFERNRAAEKAANEERQKSRQKQRKRKEQKVKEESETLEQVVKFAFGALWFFVGWTCWDLISYQMYTNEMEQIDTLDTVSKHDFFERYLKKGKVQAIYRMFNSGPNDVNTEFIIETINGKRFIVICSSEPFQRNLAQIEADLRINPTERFSTKGEFALFKQSPRFRLHNDRKSFTEALEHHVMLALVNLAILVPMVAFLGAPNKQNYAKLARQVAPMMQQVKKQESQMSRMNKGGSAGHIKPVKVENITLADVAGMKGEKEEIQEFIQFLKNSKKYTNIGATMPKGLLLHGPPGTGKTLFGKAIAGECQVPFYYVNGSDFNKSYVGEGAKLVRDLFAKARTNQPCIIYIDEIDSVGGKRSDGGGGDFGSDKDSTLNQLLVEMDGLTTNQEIVVMGATNRADVLDPALKRPGRLTRDIMCGLPDRDGREEILHVHMGKIKTRHHPRHYAPKLAELTVGMSGAQLANVCNEAALAAARSNAELIDMEHFDEAIDRVLTGLKKLNAVQAADEKRTLAVIEGGKCLVSWLLSSQDAVLKTTITPRTNSNMGHTQFKTGERQLKSEEYLIDRIAVLTAGKIAQRILQGRILESVQGDKDLARAQNIAEEMVRVYGMGKHTGQVNLSGMVQSTPYGQKQLFSGL